MGNMSLYKINTSLSTDWSIKYANLWYCYIKYMKIFFEDTFLFGLSYILWTQVLIQNKCGNSCHFFYKGLNDFICKKCRDERDWSIIPIWPKHFKNPDMRNRVSIKALHLENRSIKILHEYHTKELQPYKYSYKIMMTKTHIQQETQSSYIPLNISLFFYLYYLVIRSAIFS